MKNKLLFLIAVVAILFVSCKDDKDKDSTGPLAMPEQAIEPTLSGMSIYYQWMPVQRATSYTFELSLTADYQNPYVLELEKKTNFAELTDMILGDTVYYARVRANAEKTTDNSPWLVFPQLRTDTVTNPGGQHIDRVLYAVPNADIYGNKVTLRWSSQYVVTGLLFEPINKPSVQPMTYQLTEEDLSNGYKTFELAPRTHYKITALDSNKPQDFQKYNTVKATAYRELPEGHIMVYNANGLVDAIEKAPEGASIYLAKNQSYTISSAYKFSKSVHIWCDDDPDFRATMVNTMPLDVVDDVDYVRFENLKLSGETNVFRIFGKGIGNIEFEGCSFEKYRSSFITISTQPSRPVMNAFVHKISINDCQFKGSYAGGQIYVVTLSSQGVVFQLPEGSTVDAVVDSVCFTNSTFINLGGGLLYNYQTGATNKANIFGALHAKNCTLYRCYVTATATHMFRMSGNTATVGKSTATVQNMLFVLNSALAVGLRNVATATCNSNWFSSDWKQYQKFTATPTIVKGEDALNAIGKASTDIFRDPASGDLTIIDTELASKNVGDPRWWPVP